MLSPMVIWRTAAVYLFCKASLGCRNAVKSQMFTQVTCMLLSCHLCRHSPIDIVQADPLEALCIIWLFPGKLLDGADHTLLKYSLSIPLANGLILLGLAALRAAVVEEATVVHEVDAALAGGQCGACSGGPHDR